MNNPVTPLQYCPILGTNINVTDMDAAVAYLTGELDSLRGHYVCIANSHTTVMSYRDSEYRHIQNSSAMTLPDGKPLSLTSRRRGFPAAARVAGPDLMPRIFVLSEEAGYRHYFYGSTEQTIAKLRRNLLREWPRLEIVGMYSPPYGMVSQAEDEAAIARINEARPDFIWVALGAPKQEIWMHAHQGQLNGLMIGVGAAFDFLAGTVRRAPSLMQDLYLEWLYRLIKDPFRLLPRYLDTNFTYIWRVSRETRALLRANRHKKIAMIGHKRIPSREGGVEIVVEELAVRLVERGYQVDAYNRRERNPRRKKVAKMAAGKIHKGIRIIDTPTFRDDRLNAIVYAALATLRALFGGYGVIHYHAEGPAMMLWIARLFGIKTVATIHGLDWQRAKWGRFASRMLKLGERTAAKKAHEVIVLSQNVKEYFRTTYGRDVHFIPNGITRPKPADAALITEKYGLTKDDYILFLARIVPEKGLHYLLEAYGRLSAAAETAGKKLVVAGGFGHIVEYAQGIRRMAAGNKDILMTGFVHGQELAELFSNAYLYVLPSDIEGMALSLLEAMSYGNCCLVSDIAENTEVVGDMAPTFRRGDVDDLTEKLRLLLADSAMVVRYKRNAADFICAKHDWEEMVKRTEELYKP